MSTMDYSGYREAKEAEWITKEITKDGSLANVEFKKKFSSQDKLFFSALLFYGTSGTPATVMVADRWLTWALDPATQEQINVVIGILPVHWVNFSVKLYWTQATINAGNVVLSTRYSEVADASNLSLGDTGTDLTTSVPSQNVLKITDIVVNRPRSSNIMYLRLARIAADAADTFASDINVIGIEIVRTA